ncbi:MAG: DsrE family protein, partial [Porphyromonadaceae bacterium]|nr:DsrE family protein [Porphyromonadaceae bacterium]
CPIATFDVFFIFYFHKTKVILFYHKTHSMHGDKEQYQTKWGKIYTFAIRMYHLNCYMKLGIILETKEPEKAWNAFRFATSARRSGHEVKVFLMCEAVECEGLIDPKYNVDEQLRIFIEADGEILACGTCLKSRQKGGTEACPLSTMADCVQMVEWADKVLTF